jgi:hypothetical protein
MAEVSTRKEVAVWIGHQQNRVERDFLFSNAWPTDHLTE